MGNENASNDREEAMSGFGPARPVGVTVGDENTSDDGAAQWALDRRDDGEDWTEVGRFGSEELAREALDEEAAADGVSLEDLRVRHVD
jgi:hypothetical protein